MKWLKTPHKRPMKHWCTLREWRQIYEFDEKEFKYSKERIAKAIQTEDKDYLYKDLFQ